MSDLERVFDRISTRLNNVLCEMKPDYDDSIVGFNEAWDIMRAVFKDEIAKSHAQCGVQTVEAIADATQPRAGGIGVDWWAESVKLYRQNQKLRKALKEQHDWHLAQGEHDFGDGIKLNMADEYADSGMCERTVAVLDSDLTASPLPSAHSRSET